MTKAQLWNLKKNKRNIHQKNLTYRDEEVNELRDYIKKQDETLKNIQNNRDFYFNSSYEKLEALNTCKFIIDNLNILNISKTKKEIFEIIENCKNL